MKTYVFISVSSDRGAHAPRVLRSTPSSIALMCLNGEKKFAARAPQTAREARALPSEFPFWTWFIDNPRPTSLDRR